MYEDEAVIAVFLILPACMPTGAAQGRARKSFEVYSVSTERPLRISFILSQGERLYHMKIMTYLHIIGWASGIGLLKTLSVTRKWVYYFKTNQYPMA